MGLAAGQRARWWARGPVGAVWSFVNDCLRLLARIEPIDRALSLAAKSFTALVPLLVIVGSVAPGANASDRIIERYGLSGATASAVRELFTTPAGVTQGLTLYGVALLLFSTSSLGQSMQRLYEEIWDLPPFGLRDRWRTFAWLIVFALLFVLSSVLKDIGATIGGRTLSIALGFLGTAAVFCWTPYILVGGRVDRTRLVATAIVTSLGVCVLGAASLVYLPAQLERTTASYGLIGLTFTAVSSLFAISCVLVGGAVVGGVIGARLNARHANRARATSPTTPR